jgi:cell division protein FtsQ
MDGGGRVLEPLTVGYADGGSRARSPYSGHGRPIGSASFNIPSPFAAFGARRRRSLADALARRLPRNLGTGLTFVLFAAIAGYGMMAGGHFAAFREASGEPRDVIARALGFGLERITISGLSQLSEREVLRIAGISPRVSLPFLGAADVRAKLEAAPLIRSAAVRKMFPHELAITLVEREPYALWQQNGDLFVVAADGTVIDRLRDARFAALPLVVGPDANAHAADYAGIVEAAGPLKPRIRAGMLVSGRRWTLKMDNGIDVRLPEQGAKEAVQRLARLDREQRILDKDVLAIDLRMSDRIVVRLSEEAAAAHAEMMKKKPARGAKGIET